MLVIEEKLGVKASLLKRVRMLKAAMASAPASVQEHIRLEICELQGEVERIADGR